MKPPVWSPSIPGTKHSRVEFLALLHAYSSKPEAMGDKEYAHAVIERIHSYGVLSHGQIRQVLQLGALVTAVLGPDPKSGIVNKGILEPGAIGLMLSIVSLLHRGESVPVQMVTSLNGKVTPRLCEVLTGVTVKQFRRAKDGGSYVSPYLLRGTR